jgi:hypothetical protein
MNPASEKENKPLLALARHPDSQIYPLQTRQGFAGELNSFKEHIPSMIAPKVGSNLSNESINAQTFLASPVTTLTSSINPASQASTHDILEAYHVLTVRLKSLYPVFSQPQNGKMIPALKPLKLNAAVLAQVLRRDVERALVNPLPYSSAWSSSSHDAGFFSSYQDSTAQSRIRVDLNEEEVQRAKESVSICHCALRLISFFFRFQSLHQAFDSAFIGSIDHISILIVTI